MKKINFKQILAIGVLLLSIPSSGAIEEIVSSRLPGELIINSKYGSFDEVELKLVGIFPNGCFEKLNNVVLVTESEIFIKNYVGFTPNSHCTMALKPYTSTVQIADLNVGKYDVYIQNKAGDFIIMAEIVVD